ncbi:MAG: apolipoprotein N-acyltransferase [Myxococcales bacterium]
MSPAGLRESVHPALLAGVGGGLLALSGEPWSWNLLGFLSLGLLLEALERSGRRARPVLTSGLVGLAFGAVVNGIALYSIGSLLQAFGGFSPLVAWPIACLAFAAQGLPYAACGVLTTYCARAGLPRWLSFPACLVLALWLTPQLFPWRPSAPQVDFLWFVQIADLGGQALLDLCMAAVASGTWQALRSLKPQREAAWAPAIVAGLSLALPCGYGYLRLGQVRSARNDAQAVRVGVVQSNVGIQLKHDPARSLEILADLKRLTGKLERQGSQLTVWAETAYPYALLRSRGAQPDDERTIVDASVRGPVLIGAVTYSERGGVQSKYNTAWLLRENGRFGDRVDKSRLLAFGEYVPFWSYLPPLQEKYPSPGFEAGENDVIRVHPAGSAGSLRFGILICYEDLFADLARKVVERRADVLLNMTNDAWFGDSNEPALHDMVARLRAVETRRDLVRVVNTGVSSVSSATGELLLRTRTFTQASFVADVRIMSEITPYTCWGDWLPPLLACVLAAALVRRRLRRAP